jgi:hypothetical protein
LELNAFFLCCLTVFTVVLLMLPRRNVILQILVISRYCNLPLSAQ